MIERRLVSRPVSTIGTLIAPQVTQQEGPPIVTEGLVLNLDAGSPYSYPGAGTTWTDISGNGYSAQLLNGATYNVIGYGAINLDGLNDFCRITYASSSGLRFLNGANYTLETIARVTNIGTNRYPGLFVRERRDSPRHGYLVVYHRPSTTVTVYASRLGSGVEQAAQTGAEALSYFQNRWIHITVTYDGTDIRVYENATQVQSAASSVNVGEDSSDVQFGNLHNLSYLQGAIAVERAYSRALTASEVFQNFQATRWRFGI